MPRARQTASTTTTGYLNEENIFTFFGHFSCFLVHFMQRHNLAFIQNMHYCTHTTHQYFWLSSFYFSIYKSTLFNFIDTS